MKTSLLVLFSSFAAILGPISSSVTISPPRNVLPSRVTATVTASSLLASSITTAASAFGKSTLTLLFIMGVMTMKMISSTSITSTIGVTLMLELTFLPSSRLLIPITYAPSALLYLLFLLASPASERRSLAASGGSDQSCDSRRALMLALHLRTEAFPFPRSVHLAHNLAEPVAHLI